MFHHDCRNNMGFKFSQTQNHVFLEFQRSSSKIENRKMKDIKHEMKTKSHCFHINVVHYFYINHNVAT